jgi:hypothetical protein
MGFAVPAWRMLSKNISDDRESVVQLFGTADAEQLDASWCNSLLVAMPHWL